MELKEQAEPGATVNGLGIKKTVKRNNISMSVVIYNCFNVRAGVTLCKGSRAVYFKSKVVNRVISFYIVY